MCIVDRARVDGEIRNEMNNRCVFVFLLNVSRERNNVRWLDGELSFRRNNVNTEQNAENHELLPAAGRLRQMVCAFIYIRCVVRNVARFRRGGSNHKFLLINNSS